MTQQRDKYSKEAVDRLAADLLKEMTGSMIYGYVVDTSDLNEAIVAAYALGMQYSRTSPWMINIDAVK